MAKLIEFYIPKNFRNTRVLGGRPQPGEVIEFCPQSKESRVDQLAVSSGGSWQGQSRTHAVGSESPSHPGVA